MAEGIKNILLNCSQESNPATQSKLEEILYKINELDFQSFANVKKYADTLNLPETFLTELGIQYVHRCRRFSV